MNSRLHGVLITPMPLYSIMTDWFLRSSPNRSGKRIAFRDALRAIVSDSNLTVLSIDSDNPFGKDSPKSTLFHEEPILGETTVSTPVEQQQLADTLQQGLKWGAEMGLPPLALTPGMRSRRLTAHRLLNSLSALSADRLNTSRRIPRREKPYNLEQAWTIRLHPC